MFLADKVALKDLFKQYTLQAILKEVVNATCEDDCANEVVIALSEVIREWGTDHKCAGCLATADFMDTVTADNAEREYVVTGGKHCPSCDGTTGMQSGSIDINLGLATQNMFCYECGASWVDNYRLIGYTGLETAIDKVNNGTWSTRDNDTQ